MQKDTSGEKTKKLNKLPPQGFSKFGKQGSSFGQPVKASGGFTPKTFRVTQHKGG